MRFHLPTRCRRGVLSPTNGRSGWGRSAAGWVCPASAAGAGGLRGAKPADGGVWAGLLGLLTALATLAAQEATFSEIKRLTNQEIALRLTAAAGSTQRLEMSADLRAWLAMATARSAGTLQYTDAAAAFQSSRYYRAVVPTNSDAMTGDHLATSAGEVVIHPINHATLVLGWAGKRIYVDPVGGASRFTGIPRADLILITHDHGDHLDTATVAAVMGTGGAIIAPEVVYEKLTVAQKAVTTVLPNGSTHSVLGLTVEAVPAYNLTTSHHLKGVGNGYVVTIGERRIYISGDTQDIPEMRALRGIDVAFVAVNQPYTMTPAQAASAVRDFRPQVVYPYHHQGNPATDLGAFKRLVGSDLGVEVRLRKWY